MNSIDLTPSQRAVLDRTSGTEWILSRLSLLGDCNLSIDGKHLTTSTSRLPVVVTPSFYRRLGCPSTCKAVCCVSTPGCPDYSPWEKAWEVLDPAEQEKFTLIFVDVNGARFPIYRVYKKTSGVRPDLSREPSSFCTFLGPVREDGGWGCTLHRHGLQNKPAVCHSFLQISIIEILSGKPYVQMGHRPLGRSWRYDPAPQCTLDYEGLAVIDDKLAILDRFEEWGVIFGLTSAVDRIRRIKSLLLDVKTSGKVPLENIRVM